MADNPRAFPSEDLRNMSSDPLARPTAFRHPGMTLRDWFAGQCLAALLTNANNPDIPPERFAACVYMAADAMLAAREKRP